MGGFLGIDTNSQDNSVRTTNISDSYNSSSSFTQGFDDIGNVKVTIPTQDTIEKLTPLLIVALVIFGLLMIRRT